MKKIQRLIMFFCMFSIIGLGQAFGQDPAIICPSDITISADEDYTDTEITGVAAAFDINGEVDAEYTDIIINLDSNNEGFVRRRFNVVDRADIFCDQTITIGNNDNEGPTLIVQDITVSTDPWGCDATIAIPQPLELYDDCASDPTYTVSAPAGITIIGDAAVGYTALTVPIGNHTFTYTASDCFGNVTSADALFTVIDGAPAVAVAKQNIIINLTGGIAKLYAESVDNGSHDGCSEIKLEIRKDQNNSNYNCEVNGNATYNDDGHPQDGSPDPSSPNYDPDNGAYITFSCADVSSANFDIDGDGITDLGYVKVWLRVWDDGDMNDTFGSEGDNYNETWSFVKVINTPLLDASQTIYLGLNGANNVELTDDMLSYLHADNCDQFSFVFSQSLFSSEGTYSVNYTYADQYNNSTTGALTVIVVTGNSIACNNNVNVSLDNEGIANITPDMVLSGPMLANGDYTISVNGGPFNKLGLLTCSHQGIDNEVSIIEQTTGNQCWATVIIEDKLPPALNVPNPVYLTLEVPTEALLTVEMLDRYTHDNCGIESQTLSQDLFTSAGTYDVTYTATDAAGNSTTQNFQVIVTAGVGALSCKDESKITLDNHGMATIDYFSILGSNIYLNGNFTVSVTEFPNQASEFSEYITLDCSHVGKDLYILVKNEDTGNTCWSNLIVLDKEKPIPYPQSVISVSMNGAEPYVLDPALVDIGSFDNCGGDVSLIVSPSIFYAPGTYPIKLRVYDESGNTDFAMSTLIVEQGEGIPLECLGLTTVLTEQFGPTTLWAIDFVLNSDEFESFTMSTSPNGPYTETIDFDCSQNNHGTPFNIYVLGLNDGVLSSCTVSLTLIDNIGPIAVGNPSVMLELVNGEATLTPEMVDDGSYDNCGEISLSLSQTLFTTAHLGDNQVTLTVTDQSGNTNIVFTIVTVVDNGNGCTLEDIIFPADITIMDADGDYENLTVAKLQSFYNYSHEQVYPYTLSQCDHIVYAYADQIIPTATGVKVIREFTALDWLTNSVRTHIQIIILSTSTNTTLTCIENLTINVENGPVQLFPHDFLIGGNYDFSSILLTIQYNGNNIPDNIISPNYIGQTLTYTVTNTVNGNSCTGTFTVIGTSGGGCPLDIHTDVSLPLDVIYLSNSDVLAELYTPEILVSNYGFEQADVDVIITTDCAVAAYSYEDVVFNYSDGNYKIVRTFTIIDWLTYDPPSTVGIYTHVQVINVGINPHELICDVLPNSAPAGGCDTGHSLDDDVEWPSDVSIADYRITPDGLIEFSSVADIDARPIFFNNPDHYTATYVDLLVELTPSTLTVARIWKAVNINYDLVWHYSQTIVVDFSGFENLVTVHTATERAIPGVTINNSISTNINGEAQVTEEIVSIEFEDDVRNGLFLNDMILIQRHILGFEPLDERLIWAADLNSNGQISASDISELRKRITGESDGREWVFANTQVDNNSIVQPKATYSAFKKGDVDDNAILLSKNELPTSENISIKDKVLNQGETYLIPISAKGHSSVMGMEIRLGINPDLIENLEIENNLGFASVNEYISDGNELIIIASDPIDAKDPSTDINNAIVHLRFTAKSNILLHNAIKIENKKSYMVDENIDLFEIGGEIENVITDTNSPELASLKVFPNPTTDYLRVDQSGVSVKGDISVSILNGQGQLIMNQSSDIIDVREFAGGMYYYKITIGEYETKGKFIVVR